MSSILINYTRKPIDNILYDPRLAYSMHLALLSEDGSVLPLNHNSGVFFADGTENEDGSINPKSLQKPYVFPMDNGGFGIMATRILGDGGDDEESKGSLLVATTRDFVEYRNWGEIPLGHEYVDEAYCRYEDEKGSYRLVWKERTGKWYSSISYVVRNLKLSTEPLEITAKEAEAFRLAAEEKEIGNFAGLTGGNMLGSTAGGNAAGGSLSGSNAGGNAAGGNAAGSEGGSFMARLVTACGQIEGAVFENAVAISDEMADYLKKKLLTPVNVGVSMVDHISAGSLQELQTALHECRAMAYYSDGTIVEKRIDWDVSNMDLNKKGKQKIKGRIHQDHFAFPVAFNRADPCVAKWNGYYYFIATNDADNNHTLYIRKAKTIPELADAEEILILDSSTYSDIGGLLWAPEFHEIEGRLYIFHAATPGEFFYEESHLMTLREGGDPACKEDWSRPKRIVRSDGSDICEAGKEITLDMTCFFWEGDYYVVWSQRQFLPKDLGAWLYIAKLNPKEPWKLLTDPVVLSKPTYGWANNHTFVDEGPFALIRGDKLYLTFSSAAVDTSYVVGLLTIEKGQDLLDPENWKKKNYPILTSRSVEGEFGTGHNAYVIDEDGTVWNTYHARPGTEGVRSSGIRRVHFDMEGEPRLDVTEELDLKEEFRNVEITVELT